MHHAERRRALSPGLARGNDTRGREGVERDITHVEGELLADYSVDEQAHALDNLGQRHQRDVRCLFRVVLWDV